MVRCCFQQNLKGKKMITDKPRFQYFRGQFGRSRTRMFTGFTTGDKKNTKLEMTEIFAREKLFSSVQEIGGESKTTFPHRKTRDVLY